MRMRPSVRAMLAEAAVISGRSIAEEIEVRVEQSFRDDRIEARLAEILRAVKGGAASPDDWRRAMGIPVLSGGLPTTLDNYDEKRLRDCS